ncbi:MAG TPA: transglutaminase family protein [Phycisphaerae bacterium]|nr:transglutaminase family protein [Phycisphaerae bacterium]
MSIRVALNHVTRYTYDRPVSMSPHTVRLRPAPHARTPILAYSLRVRPEKNFLNWQQDPYSNYLARVVFSEKATELRVEVDLVADMTVINPFDFFIESSAEKYPFAYDGMMKKELTPYLETDEPGPLLAKLIEQVRRKNVTTINFIVDLNMTVHRALNYLVRMEPGVQSAEKTLRVGCGSCRDFAWLLVTLLRHLGLAARFVSGYLIQLRADVKSLDGPFGAERDFTDLHAWAEVYLPGAGWVGLDATSGLLTGEGHIPLACTAEPSTAAPVTGATDKCEVKLDVEMSLKRIYEDPRVTKPYTEEQWSEIESLGHLVDERLRRNDVRLTMGGEPTFVSIDDMDGAEWNTVAMGPNKRRRSEELIKRLRTRFAPGGFMHFGQGKWYPGESLPRWALSCYWRKDGEAIWHDPNLAADGTKNLGHTSETAQRFITALAIRLRGDEREGGGAGVRQEHVAPAYEDVWYYLWKERRLPQNVDALTNQLGDPEERKRLARVFEQGVGRIVGYALPLRASGAPGSGLWQSGAWFFRPGHMYLIPGDSPMGFRLPLESLPWTAGGEPAFYEPDPMDTRGPWKDCGRQRHLRRPDGSAAPRGYREQRLEDFDESGQISPEPANATALSDSAGGVVKTALCVEARDGVLHVFMPPVRANEDYLDLVERIEETAADLHTPVVIEGYAPPFDPRLNHLKVTPDPGVIEVNVQPVSTWKEAVAVTEGLYEDAHFSRLGTEKFMLDGRHTGTGGGNHLVIGGAVPSDSPFLRRPDLLKSLVGYWHNHPSLSYLFSGTFIGPTSQAPRADEGRPDNLYELEIAMRQIPALQKQGNLPGWLVDRVFRNLLVDLTGNTHRAEFCIDKLYSPDSSSGRLGLVEFRGFEMPPHARMSLTQQLLLRTLIARFWEQPYEAPLVRWGTELHDRFLLPHFIGEDLQEVVRETGEGVGIPIRPEWFAPHFEFRMPMYGAIDAPHAGGVHVELRQAIEPWYVLGEEPGGGGTVRFVDSSVERLQVKVTGAVQSRHAVAVNGVALPLHSTGRVGEYVAGVRYRAWQPPACLHPTIGVHTPLVFDLVDTWNGQSVAGCTYHVAHPGGRSFETFPVNAFEAESRRMARFFKFGHTPGTMKLRAVETSREFPLTLDLRRV